MAGRTFVVGDIHGERALLDDLLDQLPRFAPDDHLVFLGDYFDRGSDSRGVYQTLRLLPDRTAGRVVFLRGNHEDELLAAIDEQDPSFMLPNANGVLATYRSFTEQPPLNGKQRLDTAEYGAYLDVASWLPADVVRWMRDLPLWWRDHHATYVHAGLEGEASDWKLPEASRREALLWQREPDFFTGYAGDPLVIGHTPVAEIAPPDPGRTTPWRRGPLVAIDTGAGKGGPLTCLELPSETVYQAHPRRRAHHH